MNILSYWLLDRNRFEIIFNVFEYSVDSNNDSMCFILSNFALIYLSSLNFQDKHGKIQVRYVWLCREKMEITRVSVLNHFTRTRNWTSTDIMLPK